MSSLKNHFKVKVFLQADSLEALIDLQVKNNLLNDKMYGYGEPVPLNGKWYVFFLADVTNYKKVAK